MPPTQLTSSFASAAAGGTTDARRDGNNSNDWSRPRTNGTQTFRRPSTQSRDNLQSSQTSSAGPYIPPHVNQAMNVPRNGVQNELRYSKDDLLNIYHLRKEAGLVSASIHHSFTGPWDIRSSDNSSQRDGKDTGPEICWHTQPRSEPFGIREMDEDERQLFTTSVNSPLKLNEPKGGQNVAPGGRKASLSATNPSNSTRPGTRRRETSDSFTANGPLSPTESKTFFRNDPTTSTPPPALLRRRTDFQDEPQEKEEYKPVPDNTSPFGVLRRSGTGGATHTGPNPSSASPWTAGPTSAFGSMGAFGTFNTDAPSAQDAPDKRPGFGSARGGSRFKDILSKTSTEDASPSVKEKASFTGLSKLPEEDDGGASSIRDSIKTRPNRSETNPYDDLMPRSYSAALSNQEEQGIEQLGFSAFNSARDVVGGVDARTPHYRLSQEPMSPTNTNPYQSPQGNRMHEDEEGHEGQSGMAPYNRRDVFAGGDNRGHASFGSIRGMGGAGGLGGLAGWGNPNFGAGTPGRDRPAVSAAFGDPVFSPLNDIQSPSAFGGNSFFGAGGPFGSTGRQSKLGSIFPPAMQEQMRSDSRNDAFEGRNDPFEQGARRQDNARATFDEMKRPGDDAFGQVPTSSTPAGPPRQSNSAGPDGGSEGGSSSSQMPTAQQRQMVMPDRMRWVYRDPHGQVQGPWSGLEMHDWFKAGFFTAELQVKKLEDVDYEPLAQLVRRIGNSREPFLVPQIGVPHGPSPNSQQGNPWSAGGTSAQPPFASSFPSFGTTLTADQQNALERRKQEEQYLMARQKEFLAQRQVFMHGQHPPNGPHHIHSLQHHSSAHSLQSQPSFGSMTSPAGYQPSPHQAPIQPPHPGHAFPGIAPTSAAPPASREDDVAGQFGRMGLAERGPYNAASGNQHSFATHERNRLIMEQQQQSQIQAHENAFLGHLGRNERLEEFHELRGTMDDEDDEPLPGEESLPQPIGSQRPTEDATSVAAGKQGAGTIGQPAKESFRDDEPLSLAQQVQKTAAANKQAENESSSVEVLPISTSPLPAPAAQRTRPPVAEALAAESRSAVQTPVETPGSSIAPWADKSIDIQKGPSLKEIQEAEAKRAAEQEALLAESRRMQAEQERLATVQAPAPAPGLPSTSTWASSGSPGTPTTPGGSVWAKQVTAKPTSGTVPKKTLAQIQKEEEARKQRAAQQATVNAQAAAYAGAAAAAAAPPGNRYAQMVSKASPIQTQAPAQSAVHGHASSQSTGTGAWTTVGSGGKPKTPATVVAAPPPSIRTVSTSNVAASTATRPTLQGSRSGSIAASSAKDKAMEELGKWSKAQLVNGMKAGISVDDIVRNLGEMPAETEIIFDIIFSSSEIMDARRFADEYVRRRKLAERGMIEPNNVAPTAQKTPVNGGWSEVAKKGPVREDTSAASGFKVVSKKKGKK